MKFKRDRQAAFEELRAKLSRLKQIVLDLEVTIESIGDGVIVSDPWGRVTRMNPVAEQLTGWKYSQARGKSLKEVFRIFNGGTGEPVEDPVAKVLTTGEVQGLANDTVLESKTGECFQIADSAAPIYSPERKLLGVVLIFRDVSEQYRQQLAIVKSEERFRVLADNTPVAILLYQDDRWVYVNSAAEELSGYTQQELLKMNFWEIVHPDYQDLIIEWGRARQAGEDPRGIHQFKIIAKGGREKWVQLSGVTTWINDSPAGIISVVDITDLKATEERLRRSEEKYRTIVESIQEGYFELDLAGNFTFVNPSLCRMVGGRPEEVLGLNNRDYTTPETARRMYAMFNRIYQTGEPVQIEDYEVLTRDGRRLVFELSAYLLRDALGKPSGFAGVAREITERWDARQKIKESEARYRAIFENTGTAMSIIGADTTILMVNRKFVELSGYLKEELEGKLSWTSLVHPDDLSWMEKYHHARRKNREAVPKQYEFRFVTKQEETRQILLSIDMIPGSRDSVASLLDITELIEAQAAQESLHRQLLQAQKMEAMGTLAGGIAHDFNNILQGITGLLQGLEKKCEHMSGAICTCTRKNESFAKVFSLIERGSQLVKGLLTFSRKDSAEFEKIDINQVLEETELIVRRTLPKEIALQVELEEKQPLVQGNATQLQQVLLNLVTNARDAIAPGSKGLIAIKTRSTSLGKEGREILGLDPGEYLELDVSDTGQGISPAELPHIFDPFYTTKDVGQGTGLGLALAYGIIKAHQGTIKCYSDPGVGTSFKIYLPLVTGVELQPKEDGDLEQKNARTISIQGKTILVVDDEDVIREVSVELLQGQGCNVFQASNGQEALEVYRAKGKEMDLVLLDLGMPGLTGEETLEKLLALDPEVRIIVASGYVDHKIARDPVRYGAKAFVGKPYQLRSLLQVIHEALQE